MTSDPHFYSWLGWVISWVAFPLVSLQAWLRYRIQKKRIDIILAIAALLLFIIRAIRA